MLYESILLIGMPGNAREQAGEAQEPQQSNPETSHKNHHFIDPACDQICIAFPLLLMLISITETSSEHDF